MVGIAAEFDERGGNHLTEQTVRELLTAARLEEWADRQAHTLALLVFHSTMTTRAAATLEEAAPGLARYVAQQRASGRRLEATRPDVARLLRGGGEAWRGESYEGGPAAVLVS